MQLNAVSPVFSAKSCVIAGIDTVFFYLVVDYAVGNLKIPGRLQHVSSRPLQSVDQQFLFKASHCVIEGQDLSATSLL